MASPTTIELLSGYNNDKQMMDYQNVRHQLHRLAEPSGAEVKTHDYVLSVLMDTHPFAIHCFENSRSLLAVFDYGAAGPAVLVRADFDAVWVQETLPLPYCSCTPGVSHKCGHDGHTAMLLGLAERLHRHPLTRGRVLLFFQAAEETGEGAQQLLDSGVLAQYPIDYVFALHNIPGVPLGTVLCKRGAFTCSVVSCDIELLGHTAHAAEPEKAVCPYAAAKSITDALLSWVCGDISRNDYFLATLVEFRVGEPAYGVAAGSGVLRFTLRANQDEVLQAMRLRLERLVAEVADGVEGLRSKVTWKEYFAASTNHADAVCQVERCAKSLGLEYRNIVVPFSWGEDFGLLTQQYKGALFGLGSGEELYPLHHPDYDFPDALLPVGVDLFYEIVATL